MCVNDVAGNAWQALGAGEGTGWEPSGAQNLDEGRLGQGVDGTTDGTGTAYSSLPLLKGHHSALFSDARCMSSVRPCDASRGLCWALGSGVGVDGTTGGTRAVKVAGGDLKVGPGRHHPPRHRMSFDSINY
jgi:hypothetical protein